MTTMTEIERETQITFPDIIICSPAFYRSCEINYLKLYDISSTPIECVQINFGANNTKLELAKDTGLMNGYRILLYNPQEILLTITNNNVKPVFDEVQEILYPGQFTDIAITKIVKTLLGPPYSKCNESTHYREANCIEKCIGSTITSKYGCKFPEECSPNNYTLWIEESKSKELKLQCNEICPAECNQIKFEINRVDVEFDEIRFNEAGPVQPIVWKEIISKIIPKEMSDDQFRKKLTNMFIYFKNMETTRITQSPSMTMTILIGNIGGILGKTN